jgi:predicted Fe-Mo cluster-binding NifX family protein
MKICVPSTGQGLTAKVDRSFGRAAFFAVVDVGTMRFHCLRNLPLLPGERGEQLVAEMVSLLGVDGVLAECIDAKACHILQRSGVKVFEGVLANDSVQEVVCKLRHGQYQEAALLPEGSRSPFGCASSAEWP